MEESEKRRRIASKIGNLIENVYDEIAGNEVIKQLVVLRGKTGSDLETKLKACDKAIQEALDYIEELKKLKEQNENQV